MPEKMVIGRIVSMDRGRPTIVTPVGGPLPPASAELHAAAQNWKTQRNNPALRAQALSRLMTAAENI